jgi:hypothetical protein
MTVAEGKKTIADVLEELQRQGVFVREIELTWAVNVEPKDKPVLDHKIACTVKLKADL